MPGWAFELEPAALAERWIAEFVEGIDGTEIKPGLIKIAVNPGELLPIQRTIVRAAAITHLATGLSIMAHTGDARAANESLDLIAAEGMPAERYIVAHADQIGGEVAPGSPEWAEVLDTHRALLDRGVCLEYDAIGWGPLDRQVALVTAMLEQRFENQLLLSQDAGWYHVGEPGGGKVQPMTGLLDDFVPALRAAGVDTETMARLLVHNPARLLAVA